MHKQYVILNLFQDLKLQLKPCILKQVQDDVHISNPLHKSRRQ